MYRPESPHRPGPADRAPRHQPRVVVKLREQRAPALVASLAAAGPGAGTPGVLEPLGRRFPGVRAERLIRAVSPARLQSMTREARRARRDSAEAVPDLDTFYSVAVPRGTDPASVAGFAADLAGVESAHVQGAPTPPPVHAADDPHAASQGYLDRAPKGIDARFAWLQRGGDGDGVGFVDLEQGWTLNHEDLAAARITLVSGVNQAFHGHGTAVLGEVLSQDNTRGCVGIAPLARGRVVSQFRTATDYNTADAIISAAASMRAGDVLLLEAQTTVAGSTYLPAEADLDVWCAIWLATGIGIVVVEAGGNGANDLDAYRHPTRGHLFRRGHADFRDSGAIVVGAASSAAPHGRMSFSNYGSRVDCYGWGQNIQTTGDGWTGTSTTQYTPSFSGTSGASPIVAGAAVALQGIVRAKTRRSWSPTKMRTVLRDTAHNTPSRNPSVDRIGVMPDLRAIIRAERLGPPVGDFPLPVGDTRVAALVDAGHGGEEEEAWAGEPAYAGVAGAAAEKEINLGIARQVRAHLGGEAALTRDGDYALPLPERARQARESGAPVFVSIHSNTGRTDRAGPEVWVYGGPGHSPDPRSRVLAERISGELSQLGAGPVPVRAGDLALLHPGVHGAGRAACLVEAGSLAHSGTAARLREPRTQDAIGAAVARGITGYLSAS